ncbi:MAG TPA: virion core protein (lumpy skin disease virus) [Ruminococcus sp.]|nr:virion core protein (lumpy skin disease virus) [Ruminococcus sp.]
MGLIMAALQAGSSTLKDQWLEYFYCESMPSDVLMVKGHKRTKGNNKGDDNIITNGSIIAVADGQCMIIVEQGRIMEICAEPGEYKYDIGTEPSIFSGQGLGGLGKGIIESFKTFGRRFKQGGDTGKDQRVYYFNTKEIMNNLFGTQNPIPFRVLDRNIGLDVDISVRCNGSYTYQISDPILFYSNVCGNVHEAFTRQEFDQQMRAEFLNILQPAFAKISEEGVRPSALPGKTTEICKAINEDLKDDWMGTRGITIKKIAFNSITIPKEDEDMIKQAQRAAINRDPGMAAATMVSAQAQAMQNAASNAGGAMTGFMGMGMAQQAGGVNAAQLFQMQQQQAAAPAAPAAPAANTWTCSCGTVNQGKFCMNCGSPQPAPAQGWTCSCGTVNQGKFCMECGKTKPAGAPLYKCDKCGWTPEDPAHPPKFCPECGDIFDENDAK